MLIEDLSNILTIKYKIFIYNILLKEKKNYIYNLD